MGAFKISCENKKKASLKQKGDKAIGKIDFFNFGAGEGNLSYFPNNYLENNNFTFLSKTAFPSPVIRSGHTL